MKKFLILTWLIGLLPAIVIGQGVQFTASAPNVVNVGDQFELTFSVNAAPTDIHYPDFQDFRLLYGPSISQSMSVQYSNGQNIQTADYGYTYALEAIKPGKFTIGSAEITVKGKKYKSNPVTIEVVGSKSRTTASGNGNTQGGANNNSSSTNQNADADVASDGEIFIRVLLDKTKVLQGEYLTATVKLYSKVDISSIDKINFPEFDGFFKQDIEIPQQRSLKSENVNGVVYGTIVLKKFILIPQKSGDLKVDPMDLGCTIQRRVKTRSRGFFDDFFGPSVQPVPVKLKSKALTVHVLPLPGGKPESFNGAVGHFSMNAEMNKKTVKTNEAVTLKVSLSGNGNIKLLEAPKMNFPPDFDTYDPKVNLNVNASDGGVNGSKSFEYLLIPRNPGEFHIPAITFSYFDVSSNKYKTLSSGDFVINVEKGAETQNTNVVSGFSKEDIKFLGKDILFIKTDLSGLHLKDKYFFGSFWHWLCYIISLVAFGLIILMRRRLIKQNANIALMRNRRADKYTSKRLKQAHVYLKSNQKEHFYEELLKALWGYLSDKMSIPLSELSRDTARTIFEKKKVDADTIQQFVQLVDNCEYARYAPASADISLNEDYDKAVDLITKLQQKLR